MTDENFGQPIDPEWYIMIYKTTTGGMYYVAVSQKNKAGTGIAVTREQITTAVMAALERVECIYPVREEQVTLNGKEVTP